MTTQLILIGGLALLLGVVVLLASKSGSKAAQLENLKAEIKKQAEAQARAQRILNHVANIPADDVRKRLQNIGK